MIYAMSLGVANFLPGKKVTSLPERSIVALTTAEKIVITTAIAIRTNTTVAIARVAIPVTSMAPAKAANTTARTAS
tara:strand:- start:128 stop:355 length:228 start_codon:yes stop_codon:yes gene_type:complete